MLGLSGGIDSAVTATLAVEALGADRVTGVAMPGPYSSEGSLRDARDLARRLGVRLLEIPIVPVFEAYRRVLAPAFGVGDCAPAEENIQARIRGAILMALSNRFGHLVLSTGNKSELAVGYCTLYGDMAGGYALLSDVPKTLVYELARELNRDTRADPGLLDLQGAVGGAPPEPEGQRHDPSLPRARSLDRGPRGLLAPGPGRRAARARSPRARPRHRAAGGPQRVQAAPDAAGPEGHRPSLRRRPPLSHRAEVPGVSCSRES